MKNIKILAAVLALSMTATSCKDYLDINESPNSVPIENVTPNFVFPGAVAQTYRTQGTTMMQLGNIMMNSWAGDSYQFGGPFSTDYTLSAVTSNWYAGIWDGLYANMANFAFIENYNNADNKWDHYIAASKIMKAYYMQYIVDLYGDVPYSQAFLGPANLTPGYDNDEEIYKNLITTLNDAQTLIANAHTDAMAMGTRDIVFGGDLSKWVQFSNSIKLRMLLRMSGVSGDMATFRDAQLATMSGLTASNFVTSNVLENPGYTNGNNDKMNPFFLTYRMVAAGTAPQNYQLITASDHLATVLNGNKHYIINNTMGPGDDARYAKYTGIVDPRRAGLFAPVLIPGNGLQVKGIKQGAMSGEVGAPNDNKSLSRLANGTFSGTTTVTASTGNRGGVLMSEAEGRLLLAEAALRYPGIFPSITAQSQFDLAITASATWLGQSAGAPAYITAISTIPGLGLTGTFDQKIEAIMTQKWLSLTNVHPTEAFIEYNRTGYPWTPMATTSVQSHKPYRLMYPNSEYVANSANVPNMTSAECFTINAKTPFWKQ